MNIGCIWVYLVVTTESKKKKTTAERVAGVDLGIRTFATVLSNNLQEESTRETTVYKYNHRMDLLKKLNDKMDLLKSLKKIQRRKMSKLEKRKKNLVD
jgi:transposase